MMTHRFENYVSFALCVMGVVVLFFAGCDKRSDEAAVPSSSPESYMNDKAFRSKLDSMRKEREGLAQVRVKLIKELKAKVDAVRVKNPKADDAALKALLAKDAEYVSLEKRVADLGTAIEENRLQATKIVGRRIAPARSGKDSASPLGVALPHSPRQPEAERIPLPHSGALPLPPCSLIPLFCSYPLHNPLDTLLFSFSQTVDYACLSPLFFGIIHYA